MLGLAKCADGVTQMLGCISPNMITVSQTTYCMLLTFASEMLIVWQRGRRHSAKHVSLWQEICGNLKLNVQQS